MSKTKNEAQNNQKPKKTESQPVAKNCPICGKFMRKKFSEWMCKDAFYDSYTGGWEHD